ncbi:AAA domain-containing protein [Clostridium sp.]|uniref:AAA domain-containing protein n=1 Tax=Clostridium sp. TaxID=1506 RepID=UPI0028FE2C33|nr:AAA domain-containing protein [Clostridium sp.]MDU1032751.1 AAA domain-containing protein [Clostridium sp.]MDU4788411.1 AAA domain-containing protein [Clostridium sp.]
MDISKNLIMVMNNKTNKFEDKTKEIKWINDYKDTWKRKVTYTNEKTYTYNYNNIQWFKDPTEIDCKSNVVFYKGEPRNGALKILDFNEYIKLFFKNDYTEIHEKRYIRIEKSSLDSAKSKSCFKYLKHLSSLIKIDETNFLEKQYEKMEFISPNSVLSKYLNGKNPKERKKYESFIYPFGFNISQKEGTEKALNSEISIIEGPPGTGKTQTILNIISNAIINNKTVGVVSNNNSATSNVIEKLNKYGVGFIAAFLGNTENKEKFIDGQDGSYPSMEGWFLNFGDEKELKNKLLQVENDLNEMLNRKNELAKLKEELDGIKVEKEHYLSSTEKPNILPYRSLYRKTPDRILTLWNNIQYHIENKGDFTTLDKVKYLIKFGIYSFKFYDNPSEEVVLLLQNLYYEMKIEEREKRITEISKSLKRYKFEDKMNEYTDLSMKLFKSSLYKRKGDKSARSKFSKDDLWKNFGDVVKEYPVILSTTHSLRNSIGENYLFDYVIIDESSQVDIVSGALALSCGKNVVIVGDEKQLPNVVTEELKAKTNEVFYSYDLNEAYNYSEKSLLTSIKTLYPEVPYTLLKEHYRCNPKIIGFCNEKFYNGELIPLTENNIDNPLMVYKTVEGNHARGKFNQRELDVIFDEVIPKENLQNLNESIGIISPYRLQADEIRKYIGDLDIEADTVHKFQGREKDNIIISTVSNEMNDFISNANLINVAVSRAVNRLILVVSGNKEFIETNSNIGDLIRYISYNNVECIKESKVNSIFDYLYKSYNDRRLELLKNTNKSRYDSENLMVSLLEGILEDEKYLSIGYDMHYPLRNLIRDTSLLNDREKSYVGNINTHADFILFNKLDKSPVLVIEVDGFKYHDENEVQLERDKIKNSVLEKYEIPYLRLKTNGSDEEKRIREKLLS